MKYLPVCLKRMSAQPVRIDKSSRQTAKLLSVCDFSCDKCLNHLFFTYKSEKIYSRNHYIFEKIQADNHQNRLPDLHLYD